MERTRLVLIFSALCLSLVFSVGSVEAQKNCDEDDDGWVKDTGKCRKLIDEVVFLGIDCNDNLSSDDNKDCGDPEPPPDDGGTKGTPIIVTFDDRDGDSIQSDGGGTDSHSYAHDGLKGGVSAILNYGQFFLNLPQGSVRKLFIDFGDIVDCEDTSGTSTLDGDCVLDARFDQQSKSLLGIVECPFPRFDDGKPPFRTPDDDSCSALVKAVLTEHDVFEVKPTSEVVLVEDMNPKEGGAWCVDEPGSFCGPVMKVRSDFVYDINFKLPRSQGNKLDPWLIAFSDRQVSCFDAADDADLIFPDYLSIRAIDTDPNGNPNVGGAFGADTWHIGTFNANGDNIPKLACLLRADGGSGQADDVVGFFPMSFMYTVTICDDCPSP